MGRGTHVRIELPMLATRGSLCNSSNLILCKISHNKRGILLHVGKQYSLEGSLTEAVALGAYLQALHLE